MQACAASEFTAVLPNIVVKMSQASFLKFFLVPGLFHLCLCLGAITAHFLKRANGWESRLVSAVLYQLRNCCLEVLVLAG